LGAAKSESDNYRLGFSFDRGVSMRHNPASNITHNPNLTSTRPERATRKNAMKTTRTLLLAVIATVLLAGLTSSLQAQSATTQPAGTADDTPKLTEGDRSGGDSTLDAPAKTDKPTTQPAGGPKTGQPSFFDNPMLLLIGAMLLMFIFMGRGKRKKEAQRKAMLEAIKKGDKVTTIGGIIGTVLEVRDNEVSVKIDESSNARMRFARWAVRGVGEEAKSEAPEDKK
jgi:preprotein translocase subunit YajC